MRHERMIIVFTAAALAAGCNVVDDLAAFKHRKETVPAPITDDGQIVAEYLATLDRVGRGGAAEQAEILQTTRAAYLADPSTQHRLRYAFVLAIPGHAATDAEGARSLLGESLATPETMLPPIVAHKNVAPFVDDEPESCNDVVEQVNTLSGPALVFGDVHN